MQWSHNDNWMVTADHFGYIKYWQSNMNNVKMYQGHKEPIRGIRYHHLHMDFLNNSRIHGNSFHLSVCGLVGHRAAAAVFSGGSRELHHTGPAAPLEVTKCLVFMWSFPLTCLLCFAELVEVLLMISKGLIGPVETLLNILLVLYLMTQADSRKVAGKLHVLW